MTIIRPTTQRSLRRPRQARSGQRPANTDAHQAALAVRLTPRDRWLLRMLHEHRVLTSVQIQQLAFPSARSASQRLLELYRWRLVDRFRTFVPTGTSPAHYVLDTAGAAALAAEHGLEPKHLGYRHDRAVGIAHSLRLAHTVGVNGWFTALVAHARHDTEARLAAWWSEARCERHFGDLSRPDGYGRWSQRGRRFEFFLEYDLGTEPTTKVAAKLHDYAALATTSGITTPVLIWIPTARREAAIRTTAMKTWRQLDHPHAVPVATATAELLTEDPGSASGSPAGGVWQPFDHDHRYSLAGLTAVWPDAVPPPTSDTNAPADELARLPVPDPMPPWAPWR